MSREILDCLKRKRDICIKTIIPRGLHQGRILAGLRTRTYFRLSLVSAENNGCEPEPGNDFCDVGILSQSQFSWSSPRTTARGIRWEEHSSFFLSWNLIGQGETKVITSQKSFPGSGSQTLFLVETSDSRKYVCVPRLVDPRLKKETL